jgi:hypothetical protein
VNRKSLIEANSKSMHRLRRCDIHPIATAIHANESTHPLPQAVLTSSPATWMIANESTHPLPQAVLTSSPATWMIANETPPATAGGSDFITRDLDECERKRPPATAGGTDFIARDLDDCQRNPTRYRRRY